jgi:hypothetical protein
MFLLTIVQLFDDLLPCALVAATLLSLMAFVMTLVLMWSESTLAVGALL